MYIEKIGIVVLSFENIEDTVECIDSINNAESGEYDIQIYLVENSEDQNYLESILSRTKVDHHISIDNNGYANGNNIGIRKALQNGCDYILVINNDTVVNKDFLLPLIGVLKCHKKRISAPVIHRYSDSSIWSSGGIYRNILCDYVMVNDNIYSNRNAEFVTGCCFATTKELLQEIGVLNENYFMYNEDAEFCHRARMSGADLLVVQASKILHKISSTSGVDSPFQLYYTYRNRIAFAYEKFLGVHRIYAVLINKMKALYRGFKFLFVGKKDCAQALVYAVYDAGRHSGHYRY